MHSCNNASYRPKRTFRKKTEKATIMSKIDEKTKIVITEALTKIETRLAPKGLHVLVGVGHLEWFEDPAILDVPLCLRGEVFNPDHLSHSKIAALKNQENEILFIMRKVQIIPNLIHGRAFEVQDAQGAPVCRIRGPVLSFPCHNRLSFPILSMEKFGIGTISKFDNLHLKLPSTLNVEHKALLIAAAMLFDDLFF
ncbi:Oidioi.mRNA.OKI2018_I69.chr2.g4648.t1.cds [Oikopleura dioica]|uniref:Oidioi.mRNA.OKI2018_I69.chr2.g4648.t1.cds n=1 Tax=Oikopleura dioica TaxID=34765 RepID=A0ABN7SXP6_OIKDI|nr:Oidioi.mRNA.OKI2018_I69.chr2.g4648.t1.cds [Oikopleura dioica]